MSEDPQTSFTAKCYEMVKMHQTRASRLETKTASLERQLRDLHHENKRLKTENARLKSGAK